MEIDRNRRSEELLKLGGDQKNLIFMGSLPYKGESENFHFHGGGVLPWEGRGVIFWGEVHATPLCKLWEAFSQKTIRQGLKTDSINNI